MSKYLAGKQSMAKIITIAQQKGGAGKTTVAAHLAVALAQKGNRVAVLDIDPQGSLGHWHAIREKRYGEGYTGLTYVSVTGWRVSSEVSRLKKTCDFIVIDSPPHIETEARAAIRAADLILVPVQPSPTDLWATKPTLEIAKSERVQVKVILNRVSANSKLAATIAAELPELCETTLGNRVLFASSLMEGRAATEVDPNSLAAKEVKALVKEVLKFFPSEEEIEDEKPAKSSKKKELVEA